MSFTILSWFSGKEKLGYAQEGHVESRHTSWRCRNMGHVLHEKGSQIRSRSTRSISRCRSCLDTTIDIHDISWMFTNNDSTLLNCMGRPRLLERLQTVVLILREVTSKLKSTKSSPISASQLRSRCSHQSSLILNAVRTPYQVLPRPY
jgi:hypothetical protein